ncbi:MAG: ABC transporter ATP-binding protein, partial [Bacteroidia bacterium]|nr:ABC transporter ATP-binding protein [Bacteroidia bacterium]
MILTINNLTKTYDNGVKALSGVSLTIPTGMFGLLGPNGAGKSSLMRTICTLQDADAGSIMLDDLDMLHNKDEVRKIVGYLPQDFGFYPGVNAVELLNHFALLKGIKDSKERKESVEYLLQQTNLWEARKRSVSEYSGGMRQRFGIAQALIGNPKIIIVDEPTAGLDPTERNRFHNLLSEIGQDKIVILSTHIVEDIYNLCPNMAVMSKGEVKLVDKPLAAIEKLNGKIWHAFIDKTELDNYKKEYNVISNRLVEGKLQINVHADAQPTTLFKQAEPNLEDVYFT